MFQLARGHRFSTDDVVCAWQAAHARPDAQRLLDLGSGIGSVGLTTLGLLDPDGVRGVTLAGVEAQDVSHALARRSVARNGLGDRVRMFHGDLRSLDAVLPPGRFDLITGSPPYVPLGRGLVSPHPQRAACRMELRGSVFDYCEAAAGRLAPGGAFVFVMSARDPRTEEAPVAAGLHVHHRLDVVFREGDAPMIAVLTCAAEPAPREAATLVVRGVDGDQTDMYRAMSSGTGLARR